MTQSADVVICGAGIAGAAVAYYLVQQNPNRDILLVDKRAPLSLTSDKSGECYRNWWPSPYMVQFINRSIDLMDGLAAESGNFFNMNRRGYAYVSENLQSAQIEHYRSLDVGAIRIHEHSDTGYQYSQSLEGGISGADVLQNPGLIRQHFPYLSGSIAAVTHVRKAGWLSAQQLGTYMLDRARSQGLREIRGLVTSVETDAQGVKAVTIQQGNAQQRIETRIFINAAGPYLNQVAAMLGLTLPVHNVLHQKIVIQDIHGVIPRDAPFTIYQDGQHLDWSEEEREWLADSPEDRWMLEKFPGGLHVRPEGGDDSPWIKLGWAYHSTPDEPTDDPYLPESFPDIVIRGAQRFIPALSAYVNQMPTPIMYDGGFYNKTDENLPLIGPLDVSGAYVMGAFSGYGIMAACAAGELLSSWIDGGTRPDYAEYFAPGRYINQALMQHLALHNKSGEL